MKSIRITFASWLFSCVLVVTLTSLVGRNQVDAGSLPSSPTVSQDGKSILQPNGRDQRIVGEAERFASQSKTEKRAFYRVAAGETPNVQPDGDPPHLEGASEGAYLEILPDTRRTHDDELVRGANFSQKAGEVAVLTYHVNIAQPGRYYVWVRAHSTGSEDNGLHVGLDGQWPESGQRLQWCDGKNTWRWESRQRTKEEHCGVPHNIFLDIETPGIHTIEFSMREDGFEFDQWLLTKDRDMPHPDGVSARPNDLAKTPSSKMPNSKTPNSKKPSSKKPATKAKNPSPVIDTSPVIDKLTMSASMFAEGKNDGFYLQKKRWLAIHPEKNQTASIERTFPFPTGTYHVRLRTVGENDGQSSYSVFVDGEKVGDYTNPLSDEMFEEGVKYHQMWRNIQITEGAIIRVSAKIGSSDGKEFARARWSGVAFLAADKATAREIKPILEELNADKANAAGSGHGSKPAAKDAKDGSPTGSPTKPTSDLPLQQPRQSDGDGSVSISGELRQWHKVTLDLSGPYAHEYDNAPNPYTDRRMTVTWKHSEGTSYSIPGYFAADGNAAESSAQSGTVWRSHFAPDQTGEWTYTVSMVNGKNVSLDPSLKATPTAGFDGATGTIQIKPTNKNGRDLRSRGRLDYVGERYLKFAGSGEYFLKFGADAPETLLAYVDFDNTIGGKPEKAPLKTWAPHVGDWRSRDPSWQDGRGKGLIGAINYLAAKGCNAFSFLTYNAGGDGDNVWPFVSRNDKLHYDCSKLDQWGIVFDHGTQRGMYLHFKLQETENDDHRKGHQNKNRFIPESLDGGDLGWQRRLYCRELIARFGHNLALNWNIGEECTLTPPQIRDMVAFIAETDPYDHPIVLHTYPSQHDQKYPPMLGDNSKLMGLSMQNSSLDTTHSATLRWVTESTNAGKPWVVAFDESGSAAHAQCPDLGYRGYDGHDKTGKMTYTRDKVRAQTLWATLLAGGAGNEYYFGYQYEENDIVCEDWRSRDRSWDDGRIAIEFFREFKIPFWEMKCMDELVGNPNHDPGKFCFAKPGSTYVIYLPTAEATQIDLSSDQGTYQVDWFSPTIGERLHKGSVASVSAGSKVSLGNPPADNASQTAEDWVVVLRK